MFIKIIGPELNTYVLNTDHIVGLIIPALTAPGDGQCKILSRLSTNGVMQTIVSRVEAERVNRMLTSKGLADD